MRRSIHSIFIVLFSFCFTGCGDSGIGGTGRTNDSGFGGTGRPELGPVVGAKVAVFPLSQLTSSLCEMTSAESDDIDEAGLVEVPDDCVESDEFYILRVTGGQDIDANDDGVVDDAPVEVQGDFHAVLSGEQIKEGGWKITVVTELAYQAVRYMIDSGATNDLLTDILDGVAQLFITADLNDDGEINSFDLGVWNPLTDVEAFAGGADVIADRVESIHNGLSFVTPEIELDSEKIGFASTTGVSFYHAKKDNYVYVASLSGIEIFDISNPAAPAKIAHLATLTHAVTIGLALGGDMQIAGNYLFVATVGQGLQIIDITTPAQPQILQNLTDKTYYGLKTLSSNSIVAIRKEGDLFDITNPGSLVLIEVIDGQVIETSLGTLPALSTSVSVLGASIYVVAGNEIKIGTLENGVLTTDINQISLTSLTGVPSFIIHEEHGYFVNASEGDACVNVYNLATPTTPALSGCADFGLSSMTKLVFDANNRAYAVAGENLYIYSMLSPTEPVLLDTISLDYFIVDITVDDDRIFATGYNNGLVIIDLSAVSDDQ